MPAADYDWLPLVFSPVPAPAPPPPGVIQISTGGAD